MQRVTFFFPILIIALVSARIINAGCPCVSQFMHAFNKTQPQKPSPDAIQETLNTFNTCMRPDSNLCHCVEEAAITLKQSLGTTLAIPNLTVASHIVNPIRNNDAKHLNIEVQVGLLPSCKPCQVSQMNDAGDCASVHPLLAYESLPSCPSDPIPTHTANDNHAQTLQEADILVQQKKYNEAQIVYAAILDQNPNHYVANRAMSTLYRAQEKWDAAITHASKAFSINSHNSCLLLELGFLHMAKGEIDLAQSFYSEVARRTDAPQAKHAVCYTHVAHGNLDKAIPCYQSILNQHPDFQAAQFGLAMANLRAGNYEQGWKQLEPFLKAAGENADELRTLLAQGDLKGKHILLKATPKSGLGDTFQFGPSLALALRARGALVTLAVQKPLVTVLQNTDYPVVATGTPTPTWAPRVDAEISAMSAPAVLAVNQETIPGDTAHLQSNIVKDGFWKQYIIRNEVKNHGHTHNIIVMICSQASVQNDMGRLPMGRRIIPTAEFERLATMEGVSVYNLNTETYAEFDQMAWGNRIQKLPVDIFDKEYPFGDTAALIKSADVFFSVDTGTAHCGMRVGDQQTWIALPYLVDFRWGGDRSGESASALKNAWYPHAHVVRQTKVHDWSCLEEFYGALQEMVAKRKQQ